MGATVHRTAEVDPRAELAEGVRVGPFCVVGPGVVLGEGTELVAHVVVTGPCVLGAGNVIHPFAALGGPAQHKRLASGPGSRVVMGDGNVVREHVTIHRATEGRATSLGSDNLLMVGAHVAHDVTLGSHVTVANGVQLAGHAVVEDHATFGGLAGVGTFVRVGQSAFVAAGAMVEERVPPFVIVHGDRARVRALNVVGLRRRGVPEASIAALRKAYRAIFGGASPRALAARGVPRGDAYVDALLSAVLGGAAT
jgi:UDP-N-acetylglucosamine acyltransferase